MVRRRGRMSPEEPIEFGKDSISDSRTRRNPKSRGRNGNMGKEYPVISGTVTYPVTVPKMLSISLDTIKGYSGRAYSSYGYQDPFATASPGLIQISEPNDFALIGRTVKGGTAVVGEDIVSDWANNLIHDLHNYAASQGYSITNYNTTGSIAATFITFINNWSYSYRILAPLKTLAGLINFNRPLDAIGVNVLNNLPLLDAAMTRLMSWCVPQEWVDFLDKTCGVFI